MSGLGDSVVLAGQLLLFGYLGVDVRISRSMPRLLGPFDGLNMPSTNSSIVLGGASVLGSISVLEAIEHPSPATPRHPECMM